MTESPEREEIAETDDQQMPADVNAGLPGKALLRTIALPTAVLTLAVGVAYLKYQVSTQQLSSAARAQSVAAATDGVTAMLSYRFDTAEKDLGAATDKLTGPLRDDFLKLTKDVVIPAAKQKRISSQVKVPAAASVSADKDHAVVLLYLDQTVTFGDGQPTTTPSSAQAGLDRVGDRWLLSSFEPLQP